MLTELGGESENRTLSYKVQTCCFTTKLNPLGGEAGRSKPELVYTTDLFCRLNYLAMVSLIGFEPILYGV